MRSKKETSILQNMNDSKHEEIREEEGKTPHLHEKSSTTRKEIDAQTDDKQTTNFNRTISKISNSKMMTSQSQQNFLRAEKMKLREQIQIKKELKELEKENEGKFNLIIIE
jgi:predicted HicB family RNase H-like nuclease